jgi:hypothetical protein
VNLRWRPLQAAPSPRCQVHMLVPVRSKDCWAPMWDIWQQVRRGDPSKVARSGKPHWDILGAQADLLAHRPPPDYDETILSHHCGQLWQRDVGNALTP